MKLFFRSAESLSETMFVCAFFVELLYTPCFSLFLQAELIKLPKNLFAKVSTIKNTGQVGCYSVVM